MRAVLAPEPGAVVKAPKSASPYAAVDLAIKLLEGYMKLTAPKEADGGEADETNGGNG